MANRFAQAAKTAREATNKQLADQITAISTLHRDKLQELLPAKSDKEAFVALMAQVEADTNMDNKLAFLKDNLKTAGSVVFKVLKALI